MKKSLKKLFSIIIVVTLVCLYAVACDKKTDDDKTNASGSGASFSAVSVSSAISSAEGEDPISEGTDASQSAAQTESDDESYSAQQTESVSASANASDDIPTSEQETSASEQDASDSEDSAIWGPPISDGGGFSFNFN